MAEWSATVDLTEFDLKKNGLVKITGWLYAKEEEGVCPKISGAPLPCSLKRICRPDVVRARGDLDGLTENCGFELTIEDLSSLSKGDRIRAELCCAGSAFCVFESDGEAIEQALRDCTLRFYLEMCERRLENIHLQGWAFSLKGGLLTSLVDDDGRPIGDVLYNQVRRADLSEEFSIPLSACHGFVVDLPRKNVSGKNLHFVFENEVSRQELVIDLERFDRENTRLYRLKKALGRENLPRNRQIFKEEGFWGLVDFLKEESGTFTEGYGAYFKKHRASRRDLARQRRARFDAPPLISLCVPLYETKREDLCRLTDSVLAQSYPHFEICFADGSRKAELGDFLSERYPGEGRIHYRHLLENGGISANTNEALSMSTGELIAFADHDDFLEPDAFYELVRAFLSEKKPDLVYTDEDLVSEEGEPLYPHFKPDLNLTYLRQINYICHLVCLRRSLYEAVGGLNPAFDGAQDYDFLLRCLEKTDRVLHIPKVLYHWRSSRESTAGNQSSKDYAVTAGLSALQSHYGRLGIKAEPSFTGIFIVYTSRYPVIGHPKVSILIPSMDHSSDLQKCLDSIRTKSSYDNYEILVIENNSKEKETFDYYRELGADKRVRILSYEGAFNFSSINNFAAAQADGDYLLLLNNDTEVITPSWLEEMLGPACLPDVGIVGAKLYYPDSTVQHAGIVIGMGGFAGHILTGYGRNYTGYMGRLKTIQEVSAVTGACLLIRRELFERLHGLDERFTVALNDVDLCLRAGDLGEKVIFTPRAELFHYESKSRGLERSREKQARFEGEISLFQERYRDLLKAGDPCYNPNLSLLKGDCSLRGDHEKVRMEERKRR